MPESRILANGLHFYGEEQRYLLKWTTLLLIMSVIVFGPVRPLICAASG